MYKCIDLSTGEEIIILRPEWRSQIKRLKSMDEADRLVCQGCRQPVRVRAGQSRRWHFAHKHLANCSYGEASPRVLEARAVLFELLAAHFGAFATLEKDLGQMGFPRPLDGWVDTGEARFGCWIVETRLRVPARDRLLQAYAQARAALNAPIYTLFLSDLLHEEPREPHSLYLTTTEREFRAGTPYDPIWQGEMPEAGFSLHYLDPEAAKLITYRGLKLLHAPQWFKGHRETSRLAAVLISADGQMAHPGEAERLAAAQAAIEARASEKRRSAQAVEEWFRPREKPQPAAPQTAPPRTAAGVRTPPEPAACVECGQITDQYWMVWMEGGRRFCRCRECLSRNTPGRGTPGSG